MRKIIILGLIFFSFSCSVENDRGLDETISSYDVLTEVDGCSVYSLQFADKGFITFRNFHDYLEVKTTNTSDTDINSLSIHFTSDVNGFPRTGKGDLNTSKFYYSENISKGTKDVITNFTFEELGISTGQNIFIAAAAEFGSGKKKSEIFASDIELTGNNFYFQYHLEPFVNYAGTDQMREIHLSEAQAVPSWDEVRKLYAGMLDPGVNKKDGSYNPSIWKIINDFNDPARSTQLGDYTTTYTLGEGECSDSVKLTLRILPD